MAAYRLVCPQCGSHYSTSPGDWREVKYGEPLRCQQMVDENGAPFVGKKRQAVHAVCGANLHLMRVRIMYQTITDNVTLESIQQRKRRLVAERFKVAREMLEQAEAGAQISLKPIKG